MCVCVCVCVYNQAHSINQVIFLKKGKLVFYQKFFAIITKRIYKIAENQAAFLMLEERSFIKFLLTEKFKPCEI